MPTKFYFKSICAADNPNIEGLYEPVLDENEEDGLANYAGHHYWKNAHDYYLFFRPVIGEDSWQIHTSLGSAYFHNQLDNIPALGRPINGNTYPTIGDNNFGILFIPNVRLKSVSADGATITVKVNVDENPLVIPDTSIVVSGADAHPTANGTYTIQPATGRNGYAIWKNASNVYLYVASSGVGQYNWVISSVLSDSEANWWYASFAPPARGYLVSPTTGDFVQWDAVPPNNPDIVTVTSAPPTTIVSRRIYWGDGTDEAIDENTNTEHTYTEPGTFNAYVVAEDAYGAIAEDGWELILGNKYTYHYVTTVVGEEDIVPIVTLTADKATVQPGEEVILTWTSTDADTVDSSNFGAAAVSGTMAVYPTATITYTITVSGAGGTATDTVVVTVTDTQPTVTLAASPASIAPGASTTLTWASTNAIGVLSSNFGITSRMLSGTKVVSPTVTTTYTITVIDADGDVATATATVTVGVTCLPVTVDVSASSVLVAPGESVTISWTSTNATTLTLNGTTVAASGSMAVVITGDTTFTLIGQYHADCTPVTDTVTVQTDTDDDDISDLDPVDPYDGTCLPVTATLTATKTTITPGESVILTWTSTGGTYYAHVNFTPVAGSEAAGSLTVSPTATTVYRFIARYSPQCPQVEAVVTVTVDSTPVADTPPEIPPTPPTPTPTTNPVKSTTFVMYQVMGGQQGIGWTVFTGQPGTCATYLVHADTPGVYAADAGSATIHRMHTGTTDNGTAISWEYVTPAFLEPFPTQYKTVGEAWPTFLTADASENTSVSIALWADQERVIGSKALTLTKDGIPDMQKWRPPAAFHVRTVQLAISGATTVATKLLSLVVEMFGRGEVR